MARAFRRTTRGVEARFTDDECDLVAGLVRQLTALLEQDPTDGDEVLARLFPDGYRDDPEAAAELRGLTQPDLVDAKRGALDVVVSSLAERADRGRVVLADEQAEQWLTGLNDLRLALGTRLGVTEEVYDEVDASEVHDVQGHLLDVYDWLGWLQESLVNTLSESLDPPSS
ncbi:MAG TPA: DUF2017 domain-containing protein [Mycobacteriales bacterium]|nr:DUF2017 domain-containing protein [Mycobacteriales bacterium]